MQTEFYRQEIRPLGRLLEATRKTSVSKQENIMIIKDLGNIKRNNDKANRHYFVIGCEACGVEFTVRKEEIKDLCPKCNRIGMNVTHGMSYTRQYSIWHSMIQRTTNKNLKNYNFYKDKVPPLKWLNFAGFWEDMKDGYSDTLEIDRIDNDKPYSKENCRWVDRATQVQNVSLLMKTNTSGYRGVNKGKKEGTWFARCKHGGVINHLGTHMSKKKAALAYDEFVIKHGLNHPLNLKGVCNG